MKQKHVHVAALLVFEAADLRSSIDTIDSSLTWTCGSY